MKLYTKFNKFLESMNKPEISESELDTILNSYLEAAIWTEEEKLSEETEGSEDVDFNIHNFTPESRYKALEDIKEFLMDCENSDELIEKLGLEQVGIDLWLSRNGHGSGFFDRDYEGADKAQKCAAKLGTITLFVNEDKELAFDNI